MKNFFYILYKIILQRGIVLDEKVSGLDVFFRSLPIVLGLVRGFLFTGRKLVLMRGARIYSKRNFQVNGGLVRIEKYCTLDCLSEHGIIVGKNFKLGAHSRMIASGSLTDIGVGIFIGDNVGIGEFSYIGGAGGVQIGSDCVIGQYFSVHPENHIYSKVDRPIRQQGVVRKGISIGSDCWIGAKVTILDGVQIGNGCIVAAGSVVNSSFPDNCVIGGVPAKILKSRSVQS